MSEPLIINMDSPYTVRVFVDVEIMPVTGSQTTDALERCAGQAILHAVKACEPDSFKHDLEDEANIRILGAGVEPEPDPSQGDLTRYWALREYDRVARMLNKMDPCATAIFMCSLPESGRHRLANMLTDMKMESNRKKYNLP